MRVKLLIGLVLVIASLAALAGAQSASQHWLLFVIYLAAVLLSSGMKVCLLRSDSSMSVNFPFILLSVVQLSPEQAMAVAAISVFAQCRFRVQKLFSLVQIAFNVANAVNATAACWLTFALLRHLQLALAPALAAAAITYFFVNTITVSLIIAWTSDSNPLVLWRINFAWFLPFYLVGAALAALAYLLSEHYGLLTALLLVPAAYTIYRSYNAQVARIRDQEQHVADMEALHLRTIESLAMAIEAKDQDTHDHLLRVRVYVTEIGKMLQLNADQMQAVKTAALLHDIGKLAVPERIINKPGKLTPEEFEKMKIHPVVGADILERVRFPYPVVPIVRAHHEWWNGMGYPDGLRGDAIPIGARILTVVDSFDAMASDRPYRRAMPTAEAMGVIRRLSGTQFDPRVVDVLEQHCHKLEEQARLEGEQLLRLNTGIVIKRGLAPGAGFEQESGTAQTQEGVSPAQRLGTEERRSLSSLHPGHLLGSVAGQMHALLRRTESAGDPPLLDETLALLASRLASQIPFYCLMLYLRQDDELLVRRAENNSKPFFSSVAIPLGEGISGWVAKHEHSIVNGNATVEPNYLHQSLPEQDLRSALSIPLRDLEGMVFGVLSLYAVEANAFSKNHLRALETVETTITLALQNSTGEQPKEQTILAAKLVETMFARLDAAIAHCRANRGSMTLLICDPGKESDLASTESSLERQCQPGESVMRWGELLVVLLPDGQKQFAQGRVDAVRQWMLRRKTKSPSAPGIGTAQFPEDGETAEAILARAERRMHADIRQQLALSVPVGMV